MAGAKTEMVMGKNQMDAGGPIGVIASPENNVDARLIGLLVLGKSRVPVDTPE